MKTVKEVDKLAKEKRKQEALEREIRKAKTAKKRNERQQAALIKLQKKIEAQKAKSDKRKQRKKKTNKQEGLVDAEKKKEYTRTECVLHKQQHLSKKNGVCTAKSQSFKERMEATRAEPAFVAIRRADTEHNAKETARVLLERHKMDPALAKLHKIVFQDSYGGQTCLEGADFKPFLLVWEDGRVPSFPGTREGRGLGSSDKNGM